MKSSLLISTITPQVLASNNTWVTQEDRVILSSLDISNNISAYKRFLSEYHLLSNASTDQFPLIQPNPQRVPSHMRDGLAEIRLLLDCNNHCDHCFISNRDEFKGYSKQEVISLIDNTDAQIVVITGGEPTLHPDFIEIVRYIYATGRHILLQSHGRAFSDPEYAAKVAPYLGKVFIPVHHSVASIHDEMVHQEGAFEETWAGLRNLSKYNVIITTQTVITQRNYSNLPQLADLIQKAFPSIKMTLTYPHAVGGAATKDVSPSLEAIHPFLQQTLAKYSHLIETHYIPPCYLFPYLATVHVVDIEKSLDELESATFDKDKLDILEGEWRVVKPNQLFEHYMRSDRCSECALSDICFGIPKTYTTVLDYEFEPNPIFLPKLTYRLFEYLANNR
jgi:MoaA/NifB/PqqE/SkfB family radical SAM enzyme